MILGIWVVLEPNFQISVNGIKRHVVSNDGYWAISFGFLNIIHYLLIGQFIVKMRISDDDFEFSYQKEKIVRKWSEVKAIKKFWFIAPPLYYIKFENEKRIYFFTTSYICFIIPFFVFDLSGMGDFIKRRKEISSYKT